MERETPHIVKRTICCVQFNEKRPLAEFVGSLGYEVRLCFASSDRDVVTLGLQSELIILWYGVEGSRDALFSRELLKEMGTLDTPIVVISSGDDTGIAQLLGKRQLTHFLQSP
ncbi:MAG: hypothetical protein KDD60_04960, partial [Bdellovibrionales bacterium]|nr:hypothetical protein [Bdellovibrionales bacterium]